MSDVLTILSSVFEEPVGPELVAASSRITSRQGHDLVARLGAWTNHCEIPERSIGEFRPLITPGTGAIVGRLDVGVPELPFHAVDELKQLLLYSQSLAVAEPISRPLSQLERLEVTRNFLPVAVATLVDMAPLLREGIIHLVPYRKPSIRPFFHLFVPSIDDSFEPSEKYRRDADSLIRELDLSDYPTEMSAFSSSEGELGPDSFGFRASVFNEAIDHIINSATITQHFDGQANPILRYRHEFQVLKLLAYSGIVESSAQPEADLIQTLRLMNIPIPDLSNLSLKDIVAIRRDEEVFDEWRSLLSLALQAMPAGAAAPERISWEFRRSFVSRQRELENKSSSHQPRTIAANSWKEFWIGGISATAAASLLGGFSTATATAVTALGIKILMGMFGQKMPDGERALLNHIMALRDVREPQLQPRSRLRIWH